jgi:ubiquinone/menaquinone biosynthesis C-methylase UbiE
MKRVLRRWPRLYGLLQRVYYASLYVTERHVFGTGLQQWLWRHRRFEDWARRSVEHPHRAFLVERVGRFAPVASVLEIGCNAGPNLVALRRAFPAATLFGIDVNRRAIAAAQVLLADAGVENVTVAVGAADDLARFADRSVDIVFSDATLMYVGPDKIGGVLREMTRVARKAIVLNEWQLFEDAGRLGAGARSRWHYAHWIHDFQALLAAVPAVRSTRVEHLPKGLWQDEAWESFGAIVEGEL